jgi:hypothetical protein
MLWLLLAIACGDDALPPDAAHDAASCDGPEDCDDGRVCNGVETCAGVCVRGEPPACDDAIECTQDLCLESMGGCVHRGPDADGDGHVDASCSGDDCDDGDPLRAPGFVEICDPSNVDEDCDASTFGARDADGDGEIDARCCNGTACGEDCDDMHPGVSTTEAEQCDAIDNDCDDLVDEGVTMTVWIDADGDGFASDDGAAESRTTCAAIRGFATARTDCDDSNRYVNPGLPELCDELALDEDCDGVANPAARCMCTGTASRRCPLAGECAAGTERCISGSWTACSIAPQPEACDGLDEDCDGTIDEALRITCWPDGDNDGYAPPDLAPLESCPAEGRTSVGGCPPGRTNRDPATEPTDCDDRTGRIRPGAIERLDGVDEDCDMRIDEGAT